MFDDKEKTARLKSVEQILLDQSERTFSGFKKKKVTIWFSRTRIARSQWSRWRGDCHQRPFSDDAFSHTLRPIGVYRNQWPYDLRRHDGHDDLRIESNPRSSQNYFFRAVGYNTIKSKRIEGHKVSHSVPQSSIGTFDCVLRRWR